MSAWKKIPASIQLTNEFNGLNPNRDKGADGDVGDSHHTSSSDHTPDEDSDKLRNRDADHINEVHAKDIDSTGPWPGTTFDTIMQYIIGECRKDNNVGKDHGRFRYIIWNHYIYEAPHWNKVLYTATSDPHTNHAHFSFEYITELENDTRPYGILETFGEDFPMDQAEFNTMKIKSYGDPKVRDAFRDMLREVMDEIKITDYADKNTPQRQLPWSSWIGYSDGRADVGEANKKLDDQQASLSHAIDIVTETQQLIESHISGIEEGKKIQNA